MADPHDESAARTPSAPEPQAPERYAGPAAAWPPPQGLATAELPLRAGLPPLDNEPPLELARERRPSRGQLAEFGAPVPDRPPGLPAPVPPFAPSAFEVYAQRLLTAVALLGAATYGFAWTEKGQGPSPEQVHPSLREAPFQGPTDRAPFELSYAGERYQVKPVAEYRLFGLIVSHNDPTGLGDSYHDERSLDTKDLCVLWGSNLASEDYKRAEFESTSWRCRWRFPPEIWIEPTEVSNNHLITDRDEIREQIESLRIGDQVEVQGLLVDYRGESWRGAWRQTSITRDDVNEPNKGCEVIFVEKVEVLARGTPSWYAAFTTGWLAFLTALVLKALLFVRGSLRR